MHRLSVRTFSGCNWPSKKKDILSGKIKKQGIQFRLDLIRKKIKFKEKYLDYQSLLDIIIINYNSTDCLIRCLESVFQDLDDVAVNIFVADNNSTDNVQRIRDQFPGIHLILNQRNIGFGNAVNQCIAMSASPYLMLLNPDTIVTKGFFSEMLRYMESNHDVGIIGPAIYDHDMEVQGSARSFPTPITALFGRSAFLTRFFPNNRITRRNILNKASDGKTPMPVDWVSGACMLVRRKAVNEVGLMDRHFFMYWEDADWCHRMTQKGWAVLYYPKASLIHYAGVSSEQNLIQSVVEFHKSAYYLFSKYHLSPFGIMRVIVMAGLGTRVCFLLALHGIRRRLKRK